MKQCILILMLAFILQSCNDDNVVCGGHCVYDSIPGTATIRVIAPDTLTSRVCENAVFVYFDFVPEDSSASDHYTIPNWPDTDRRLLVGSGVNPPSTWVEAEGLGIGTQHDCVRLEEKEGTCTPVIFEFLDIDYARWTEYCERVK